MSAPVVAEPPGAPVAARTVEDGLDCTPEDLETGEWTCIGGFDYSLECFARQTSAACGVDESPKSCTSYGTCQHMDFGFSLATLEVVIPLGEERGEDSCQALARGYMLANAPSSTWAAITYTWYIDGPPPGGGSARAWTNSSTDSSSAEELCYITFYNFPVAHSGTGPQCGTVESACTVACTNPQTCQLNGAWVTDAAQCGTMVGPCGPGSGTPLYSTCRDASHGEAPDEECGDAFVEGKAPATATLAEMRAQAAAQWAASGSRGEPVYDTPITCLECSRVFSLSAQEVNRHLYATVAMSREDPRLHLLAGSAYFLARDNPTLSQTELTAALNTIASALNVYPFNPETDGSGPRVRTMIRILARAEPQMITTTAAGRALRAYAQTLLRRMHNGLSLEQGLATAHSLVDRYGEVDSFNEATWAQLHDLAQGNAALAAVVNGGGIGARVGVHTTHTAAQILASHPMGSLAGFVLPRLLSDGSLSVTEEDARGFVLTASTSGLSAAQQYSDMLNDLNVAEQAYRASIALREPTSTSLLGEDSAPSAALSGTPTPEEAALQAAITAAKARGKQLKEQLDGVQETVTGGLGLVSLLLGAGGEEQFAADLQKFSKALGTTLEAVAKYAESSVKIAETVSGVLDLGVKGFQIVSAAVFTGQIIGAVFQLFSLLRKPAEPAIEQIILTELRKLHHLVEQVQTRMVSRFNRVDRKLNDIHRDMQARFALVNWELGRANQNVEEVQAALYGLHIGLNRLDQNMYEYFTDAKNDPFELAAWTHLGWDSRNPMPMRYLEDFVPAESMFSKWGAEDAKNSSILAGIDGRGANPAISPADELATYKLSYNINYLREFPAQLGLPMLSGERIASPKDWMVGAGAYAQLFEEQPVLGGQMISTRHSNLTLTGTQLDTALKNIGKPLFAGIHARYTADWAGMKSLIEQAEFEWRHSPTRYLYGIDLWGGPDQEPAEHYLKPGEKGIVPCAGGQWGDYDEDGAPDYIGVNPARWNHDALRPLLIADNLNLDSASIDLCGEARWSLYASAPMGVGNHYELSFRLHSTVYVRYTHWNAATNGVKSELVEGHRFVGGEEFTVFVHGSELPTFNPNSWRDPQAAMVRKWGTVSQTIPSIDFLGDLAFRTTVRDRLPGVLKDQQRQFYSSIATRMNQAGDALQLQAKRMTGTRLLWQAYAALALPLSVDHDEYLRGLLYGDDAVLWGYDTLQDVEITPVMNDVQDMYSLFSAADELPAYNILQDLHPAVTSRADRLRAVIDASLDAQAEAGGPEVSAWVEPTLLRLRLSMPD
ncbi:hypothetical protein ACN6A1_12870 [Myxococcus virescens]|uniref:hypothetical protein n=1 Tax=Myxococcus virescens TaxID=83456 RepID=UPI003DA4AD99